MLSLGGAGNGLPFHRHGAVFAETVFGRRRWFVSPPERSPVYNPLKPSLAWLPLLDSSSGIDECVLEPSDLIYVPPLWQAIQKMSGRTADLMLGVIGTTPPSAWVLHFQFPNLFTLVSGRYAANAQRVNI